MELVKINPNDESFKFYYLFAMSQNDWKESLKSFCLTQKARPPKQGSMSDYDYCRLLYKLQKDTSYTEFDEYLLISNNIPVTSIKTMKVEEGSFEICYFTLPQYRRMGYATKALELLEEELFKNEDTRFFELTDVTIEKITTKIAKKLGYSYVNVPNRFVKFNPNIKKDELSAGKGKKLSLKP